jgi:hypothetical protein
VIAVSRVKSPSSYDVRRFINLKYDEDWDHRAASVTDCSHDQTVVENRATRIKMALVTTRAELDDVDDDLPVPAQLEGPVPEDLADP